MALLAFLGTGDEFTDTTAHLTGFVSGVLLGLALGLGKRFLPGS
jgi:membrane associated rhomboid family serine protease